jgi:hypothetical protein
VQNRFEAVLNEHEEYQIGVLVGQVMSRCVFRNVSLIS